jgi:hypothetical protein
MAMNGRFLRGLGPAMVMGVALVALPHCELLVNLDRGEVDGGVPDGCPICTNLTDGGAPDGTKDSTAMEDGSTDAGGDATPSDGDAEGATTDSSVGE